MVPRPLQDRAWPNSLVKPPSGREVSRSVRGEVAQRMFPVGQGFIKMGWTINGSKFMSESEVCKSVVLGQAQRRAIAGLIPTLAERLKLDEVNSRTISFTVSELKRIDKEVAKALVHAPTGMVRNSMYHVKDLVSKAIKDVDGIGSIPKAERIYQFKIALMDSKPRSGVASKFVDVSLASCTSTYKQLWAGRIPLTSV